MVARCRILQSSPLGGVAVSTRWYFLRLILNHDLQTYKMDLFARLDGCTIAYIAQLFARDDEISNLIRLAGVSRRLRMICLQVIAEFIRASEARRVMLPDCEEWRDEQDRPHRCNLRIIRQQIRVFDLPARIEFNGTRQWYHHGHLHRVYGPTTYWPSGWDCLVLAIVITIVLMLCE